MPASTASVWSGLTASTSVRAVIATSEFETVALAPVSFVKAARANSKVSLAMSWSADASFARMNPLARAVAILPAPRNPMEYLIAMPALYHAARNRGSQNRNAKAWGGAGKEDGIEPLIGANQS